MRIISGQYKGKRIPVPKNFHARPTTDFAKENLFNILANYVDFENLTVLDLFSGTGSISFEFASRGATRVDTIELNYRTFLFIRKIVKELGFHAIRIIHADVFKYLKKCKKTYDLIFADPPYDNKNIPLLPDLIFDYTLLKEEGLFILEHSGNYSFEKHQHFFELRKYGSVHFSFFRKNL
ncbi:MAG: RsmD family RNA methyltransferase [Bacteroidales bacterium]|nr:RsmD family RNA methyltransferase [Bacteroidales bacterium]